MQLLHQYRDASGASQVTEVVQEVVVQPEPRALCRVDAVPNGAAYAVSVEIAGETESLIVLRKGDSVRVFHNVCPHAGRQLDWSPGKFLFSSGQLVCAAHGASFSVPDGLCVAGPCRGQSLNELAVTVRDGQVYLAG